jgi:AraC-like DNA-binding protein
LETLIIRRPGPPVDSFVDCLWYYRANTREPRPDRVLPHGAFELVISIGERSSDSLIAGPRTEAMIVDPVGYSPLIGAHFRPGGVTSLFRFPADEFLDLDVPLLDVWPKGGPDWSARIGDMSQPDDLLRMLERELASLARTAGPSHPAVSLAVADFHSSCPRKRVRDLVADSGLSQRRFIQIFKEEIGMGPKRYARIQRFQRTLRRITACQRVDWAAIAVESGYADQAHLIREFRHLTGLRPTEYAPRWSDQPNHVPFDR